MSGRDEIKKYLPLTETTFYILLALREPLHGYSVMQKVQAMSEGVVEIGPGTLYGAFSNLEKGGLIRMVKEDNRRKYYLLTPKGKQVLTEQLRRLKIMTRLGNRLLDDHR
jgi:DNA-binding PadR family transcriptional regulator